jgi:hypothetical protein
MSDFWTWAVPLGLYGVGLLHHAWAWRHVERASWHAARQQRQLEMLREAIALAKYGALQESEQLIIEAAELPE